jgi:Leucine-rich repeat (LRR) protein
MEHNTLAPLLEGNPSGDEERSHGGNNGHAAAIPEQEVQPEAPEGLAVADKVMPLEEALEDIEGRVRRELELEMLENTVEALAAENVHDLDPKAISSPKNNELSSRKKMLFAAGFVLCAGAVAGVLGALLKPSSSSDVPQPSQSPQPSSQASLEPYTIDQGRLEAFRSILEPLSRDSLFDTSTDAFQALEWIAIVDSGQLNPLDMNAISLIVERYVLALLYFATDGPNWFNQTDYLTGASVCDWKGIDCDLEGVSSINLGENNLSRSLPSELFSLSTLEVIWLNDNALTGTLTTELGLLSNLGSLRWQGNQFSGSIPTELGMCTALEHIDLASNALTGRLPSELGRLVDLLFLHIGENTVRGTLPSELSLLTKIGKDRD